MPPLSTQVRTHATVGDRADKLASWKEIAAHLGRDERTAKRWEIERGLPIHRPPGGKRAGVFAYASELDIWLEAPSEGQKPPLPPVENAATHGKGSLPFSQPEQRLESTASPDSPAGHLAGRLLKRDWHSWAFAGALALAACAIIVWIYRASAGASSSRSLQANPSLSIAGHTPAPRAEEAYLRGRYYWNLRTADGLSKAIDAYTQAIVMDPSYAEAYAGLAEAYDLSPQFGHAEIGDSFGKAKAAAERAIALNPDLAAAHRARAFALFFWDWDISGSDAEFNRALALDPTSAETHHWYASSLHSRLEGVECIRQIDEARRLSPNSPAIAADAAFFHANFGDLDAGMKALREIEETQPTLATPSYFLRELDFARGDFQAYIQDGRRYAAITRDANDLALADGVARGWAHAGKTGLLEARARVLSAGSDRGIERAFNLAQTWVLLGSPGKALPYFRASFSRHQTLMISVQNTAWWKALQEAPDYADLSAQIRESTKGQIAHPAADPVFLWLPK